VPVVLHAGSAPKPGKFTGPIPVLALLRRHPRLVLVIAHLERIAPLPKDYKFEAAGSFA